MISVKELAAAMVLACVIFLCHSVSELPDLTKFHEIYRNSDRSHEIPNFSLNLLNFERISRKSTEICSVSVNSTATRPFLAVDNFQIFSSLFFIFPIRFGHPVLILKYWYPEAPFSYHDCPRIRYWH